MQIKRHTKEGAEWRSHCYEKKERKSVAENNGVAALGSADYGYGTGCSSANRPGTGKWGGGITRQRKASLGIR